MEIIFEGHDLKEEHIEEGMARKNEYYQELIANMTPADVLPGSLALLEELRQARIKVGLGSASKNARTVLDAIGLSPMIDVIGDAGRLPGSDVVYPSLEKLTLGIIRKDLTAARAG